MLDLQITIHSNIKPIILFKSTRSIAYVGILGRGPEMFLGRQQSTKNVASSPPP